MSQHIVMDCIIYIMFSLITVLLCLKSIPKGKLKESHVFEHKIILLSNQ